MYVGTAFACPRLGSERRRPALRENLYGPLEDVFADLGAEVLESALPYRMEGKVGPGADCGSPVESGDPGVGQSVHP